MKKLCLFFLLTNIVIADPTQPAAKSNEELFQEYIVAASKAHLDGTQNKILTKFENRDHWPRRMRERVLAKYGAYLVLGEKPTWEKVLPEMKDWDDLDK